MVERLFMLLTKILQLSNQLKLSTKMDEEFTILTSCSMLLKLERLTFTQMFTWKEELLKLTLKMEK